MQSIETVTGIAHQNVHGRDYHESQDNGMQRASAPCLPNDKSALTNRAKYPVERDIESLVAALIILLVTC